MQMRTGGLPVRLFSVRRDIHRSDGVGAVTSVTRVECIEAQSQGGSQGIHCFKNPLSVLHARFQTLFSEFCAPHDSSTR